MVSPQGKPYDAAVVSSAGGELFERTALKQLKGATFNPATLNGKPISSMSEQRIVYHLTDMAPGVTLPFYGP
jgi:TonB family protein